MNATNDSGEAISSEGLAALEAELEDLELRGRQEMAARIKAARDLGDLKENAEYHIAKEDQAHLETRILRLRGRLGRAVVVEVDPKQSAFGFGRTAEVVDQATGATHTWTIVGTAESDFAAGKLSAESPVGRALLDRAAGEVVSVETPGGTRRYRVERLLP